MKQKTRLKMSDHTSLWLQITFYHINISVYKPCTLRNLKHCETLKQYFYFCPIKWKLLTFIWNEKGGIFILRVDMFISMWDVRGYSGNTWLIRNRRCGYWQAGKGLIGRLLHCLLVLFGPQFRSALNERCLGKLYSLKKDYILIGVMYVNTI